MRKIENEEVTSAMIQQAAQELQIRVPIRSWKMEGGRLVLFLAYGGTAEWPPDANGSAPSVPEGKPERCDVLPDALEPGGTPWRFLMDYADTEPKEIPEGSLRKHKKQILSNIAFSWGFQSNSDYVKKVELVEALSWLREQVK